MRQQTEDDNKWTKEIYKKEVLYVLCLLFVCIVEWKYGKRKGESSIYDALGGLQFYFSWFLLIFSRNYYNWVFMSAILLNLKYFLWKFDLLCIHFGYNVEAIIIF